MADLFGALALPSVATEDPVGDPTLGHLAGFCQAVLNAELGTAWNKLSPRPNGKVVSEAFTHDPLKGDFPETALPALFIYREKGKIEQAAADDLTDRARIILLWMPPPEAHQTHAVARDPFGNAIGKTLALFFRVGRHPAWAAAGDSDPTAPSFAADEAAWLPPVATQLATATYLEAVLNGPLGVLQHAEDFEALSPRRIPTITSAPAAGAYNTAADIVITAINWYGAEIAFPVRLTLADGGETLRFTQDVRKIVSVAFPAMLTTDGFLSVGSAAVVGHGSQIAEVCQLWQPAIVVEHGPWPVEIGIYDDEGIQRMRIRYDAVKVVLEVVERNVESLDRGAHLISEGHDVEQDIYSGTWAQTERFTATTPEPESD
jgi:hypothetical protein